MCSSHESRYCLDCHGRLHTHLHQYPVQMFSTPFKPLFSMFVYSRTESSRSWASFMESVTHCLGGDSNSTRISYVSLKCCSIQSSISAYLRNQMSVPLTCCCLLPTTAMSCVHSFCLLKVIPCQGDHPRLASSAPANISGDNPPWSIHISSRKLLHT